MFIAAVCILFFTDQFFDKVKFVYEAFRRLRPGIPLMALYGRQKQLKRVGIFNDFCKKTQAVLFATDIAARGLGKVIKPVVCRIFHLPPSLITAWFA